MKYLKTFNLIHESKDDQSFYELESLEFFESLEDHNREVFNEKEIDLIKSYFVDTGSWDRYRELEDEIKIWSGKSGCVVMFNIPNEGRADDSIQILFDYHLSYINYNIYKTDDEWYYIKEMNSNWSNPKYYRCDQIDGLEDFLNTKIETCIYLLKK